MKKQLRRRVIIREYDYNKVVDRALPSLYHKANFVPITLKELEQEHLLMVLSEHPSQKLPMRRRYKGDDPCYQYPKNYLWEMQDILYNKSYVDWFSEYDKDGYMWIQARKNTPRTLLGWGTFEYNY